VARNVLDHRQDAPARVLDHGAAEVADNVWIEAEGWSPIMSAGAGFRDDRAPGVLDGDAGVVRSCGGQPRPAKAAARAPGSYR
jgi:hypothetical protein